MEKIDILSLSLEELEQEIVLLGEKKFRAKQIFDWVHKKRVTDFEKITSISTELRTKISLKFCINQLIIARTLESCIDNTVKYLYGLSDGNFVETVLMEYNHGNSLCISTQVGCKMGCDFCASTIAGFVRNLEPSEMLAQLYMTEKSSGLKISSIVLMGIGEPLDNYDNVIKFLRILSCPEGTNLSLRHITLSTCGLVDRIDDLAKLKLGLTLSVSLHSADDKRRSEIMPINRKYNIDRLIESCKRYIKATGRRVTFEYAVIDGVNSSIEDARKLATLIRGMNAHVNLIPVNKVKEKTYNSKADNVKVFQQNLSKLGINATIRRTLGSDINAACGQLRRENLPKG